MLLHRYFGSHADTTLAEERLLLATASSFNDPFEFTYGFTGEYSIESALEELQNVKVMLGSDRFASDFKELFPLDLHRCLHDQSEIQLKSFRSKGLGWKYENEVRLILQKKDVTSGMQT